MTAPASPTRNPTDWKGTAMQKRIAGRYAAERRFKLLGMAAVLLSAGFLAFLLISMIGNGARGFTRTEIALPIDFRTAPMVIDPATVSAQTLAGANLQDVTAQAAIAEIGRASCRERV